MIRDQSINNMTLILKSSDKNLDERKRAYVLLEKLSKVFNSKVVHRTHKYYNEHGLNVCFFLSTSHIIYSSWPEYDAVILDISTCAKLPNFKTVKNILKKDFSYDVVYYKLVKIKSLKKYANIKKRLIK